VWPTCCCRCTQTSVHTICRQYALLPCLHSVAPLRWSVQLLPWLLSLIRASIRRLDTALYVAPSAPSAVATLCRSVDAMHRMMSFLAGQDIHALGSDTLQLCIVVLSRLAHVYRPHLPKPTRGTHPGCVGRPPPRVSIQHSWAGVDHVVDMLAMITSADEEELIAAVFAQGVYNNSADAS
jgi:hypothetical protein